MWMLRGRLWGCGRKFATAANFTRSLVFKGGTSLSKVFGVVERFSEDIDLSLSPDFLQLPPPGASRNQANKWLKKAEAACGAVVEKQIAPVLEQAVLPTLGVRGGARPGDRGRR